MLGDVLSDKGMSQMWVVIKRIAKTSSKDGRVSKGCAQLFPQPHQNYN